MRARETRSCRWYFNPDAGGGQSLAWICGRRAGLRPAHSQPDIYAAGDITNWPDRITGKRIRVEHWIVAQRQGQAAAGNMLGLNQEFAEVPFFWSKFFDLSFRYVGHAEDWDEVRIEGDVRRRDAVLCYSKAGQDLAVATVGRDRDALLAERAFQARALRARLIEAGEPIAVPKVPVGERGAKR